MNGTIKEKDLNETNVRTAWSIEPTGDINERPPSERPLRAFRTRFAAFHDRFREMALGVTETLGGPGASVGPPAARVARASDRRLPISPAGMALLAVLVVLAAACGDRDARAREPAAGVIGPAGLNDASISVGDRERRFEYYVPAHPTPRPPIILAFHGSGGSGARLRGFMGGELQRLAEERGFVAVYAQGFEGNWNGCRASSPSSANSLEIDDVGFVRALVVWLGRELEADPARVHAIGFSGGGHMAYRLALEIPDEILGVAAIAASLPVEGELDCESSGRPVSVMIVNGTADPVNPYDGGEVMAPGGTVLGRVRSTRATAE